MKTILFLVQKEFLQIFRDKFMLRLIFMLPIIQLMVLANAATYEIHDLQLHVVDQDLSNTSHRLTSKLDGSAYFEISGRTLDVATGYKMVEQDRADLILKIPKGFERDLAKHKSASVQILINAINGTKGGLSSAYIQQTIAAFNAQIRTEWAPATAVAQAGGISIAHRNWYNMSEDYRIFMVPGILVSLVTMLSMFLSAINIVREKEIGTIEQLNVTTITKGQFIIGKIVPFAVISLVVLTLGLLLGYFVFHVPVEGSLPLLYAFATIYIISAMGLGIFISNISASQQQAMFTSFFFFMIFILMSGLFTPIESMPEWAQWITKLNPLSYFIQFMRMVLLKGSAFADVAHLFLAMGIYAGAANLLAMLTYRKTMS